MKKSLLTAILALSLLFSFSQAQHSRVKLYAGPDELKNLAGHGLALDHGIFKAGAYVILELSSEELAVADELGVRYDVLIPDMEKYYSERNAPFLNKLDEVKRAAYTLSREWPVPEGFDLGTCGGFFTIDDANARLDEMAQQYPDLISPRYTLNQQTHNDRDMFWVRLSDNPTTDEDEPEVLYTGMHHAREGIGIQLLFYYMYYLLENYDTDPDVQYIVNNFELYFIPIMNPDGYGYNIQNQPNGGGMWRKNRRQNDDGSYGVDINRNYSYMWAYDDYGSSGDPSDETYRGPEACSEPEIQNIRDFCEDHQFRIALNYHSYSGLLLYPWGWSPELCDDDSIFWAHSDILNTENGYSNGPGYTTIYPTNGGSDDWFYGEQETKNMIYAYTPEVGSGDDGFWPAISNIIPLCQENMYQNIMAAKLSGPYAVVRDLSPSIIENKTGLFFFEIQRLGLQDNATFTVSVEPLNDAIATVSSPFAFSDINILENESAAFTYTLKDDITSGASIEFLLSVNNGLATFSDTIRKIYGTAIVIFEDSASTFDKWSSNKWNITTQQYHSPATSIADSPNGQYQNDEYNIMTLDEPIDLSDVVYANLGYWAKWDIESGYDYVQVLISDDNGASWNAVAGKFTHPGNSNQAVGEPLYDGTHNEWVKEEISLQNYIDKQILIRFALTSDVYVVGDGFFWDDMTVTVVDLATGVGSNNVLSKSDFISIQPNPASETARITFNSDKVTSGTNTLMIYNSMGILMHHRPVSPGENEVKLDVTTWPSGIYFCGLVSENVMISVKKFIVR